MRRYVAVAIAVAVATAVLGAGAVTSAGAARPASPPGVTGSVIKVGGLASPPSVLNVPYEDGFAGAKAFFDTVNKKGVFGKKFQLVAQVSDQGAPSGNIQAVRTLVEEKKVFAVLPIETNSFAGGAYLAQKGVPAFGYNIDAGYCGTQAQVTAIENASPDIAGAGGSFQQCPRKNIFGEKGSFLCFNCPSISPALIANKLGLKRGAIFAYTAASSVVCATGEEQAYKRYGIDLVYEDKSLQFGFADASADVAAMKANNVQFVATCMDFGGAFKISKELKQAGKNDVVFYAPEGYRDATIQKYGKDLNGWYFPIGFTPWQSTPLPKGSKAFLAAMKKAGLKPSEQAQAGWINAQLLYEGIKKAGKNFTRASVINAINSITDFTADGILPPINWTTDGHGPGKTACAAFVQAKDGKFLPVFGQPGQPFLCYSDNPQPPDLSKPFYLPLKPGETIPTAAG